MATAAALLWRVAAFMQPSSLISIPDGLRLPLALLGVLFLSCGIWAWWLRPGRWTTVFLISCLGGGVHWGGAIGFQAAGLELGFFFLYMGCTVAADAALLHLALIYPSGAALAKAARRMIYAPAALGLLAAPIAGFVPRTTLEPFVGLLLVAGNLLSWTAGIVFLVRLFRSDPHTRRSARLPLIVGGIVIAAVLAELGTRAGLPGHPETWNLALGIMPICMAIALVSHTLDVSSQQTV